VLYVSGISHPIDFVVNIIDVLPVNMLSDLNKLIILYKNEVQNSKRQPISYTSKDIDISRQVGFIEERYTFKNNKNLTSKLIDSINRNRLNKNKSSLTNTMI